MIDIDYSRDSLISEMGHAIMKKRWMAKGESSPQEAWARAALAYCNDLAHAQRMYDYASKGWLLFASPVISNAPKQGEPFEGLPISCFLSYVPNSIDGLTDHETEFRYLSVKGGGVAGHWSAVETISDRAPGPIPFIHCVDSAVLAYSQGRTRRGAYVAYMNIDHPDIEEFIDMRIPSGDIQRKSMNIHNAVNLSDKFMKAVRNDGEWNLIDPKTYQVKKTLSARYLWDKILDARELVGEPFMCFIDACNAAMPNNLRMKGYECNGSNLCTEITLATAEDYTAVCCLSSPNAEFYDEWKNTNLIYDTIIFLDNVNQAFIDNAPPELSSAIRGASSERSLGLGLLGLHTYLQKNGVALDSFLAYNISNAMFKNIKSEAVRASEHMAKVRGEYPLGIGTGRRNAHLLAVAPNATTAPVFNSSFGIEPWLSNLYTHRSDIGNFVIQNKYLQRDLQSEGLDNDNIWESIHDNGGSVQHLTQFSKRSVYKTAMEIDQRILIRLAAGRQPYICQGQSLNLFIPKKSDWSYVNAVHLMAHAARLKTVYYLRTESIKDADQIGLNLKVENPLDMSDCDACAG